MYASGGTLCVAAYSSTRALYASYNGPLYQIQRSSDGTSMNIGLLSAGGDVNAAPQVSFCSGTTCTITKIYDQSPNHSDLPISWGGFWHGPGPNGSDVGANAMALPMMINGHQAFGVRVTPGTGNGHMNAMEFGSACWFGGCTGSGPWVEADLENGMYSTSTGPNTANNPGVHYSFVSAWEKNNGTSNFTLKYGNAASGGLTTTYSGQLPNGYSPMHEEADILLGTGGDNSNGASGEFFEGSVTSGYPSDATENAVQAELTTAGYAQTSAPSGPITSGDDGAKGVGASAFSTANGNKIQMWDCTGGINQQWTVEPDGTLQVYGKCMDITGANYGNGTLIELWDCNGGGNQQWHASNGTLVNPASGKCLDDPGPTPPTGPSWSCGPAMAAATSNGTCLAET